MPVDIATSGIVAQAFRLLEMSPPSSLGDASEQAVAAAEQYGVALEACLAGCDWSFASRVGRLAQVAASPTAVDPELTFEFERPADLLVVRSLAPCDIVWRLDADRLRTDFSGPIHIRYTARIEDETRLPAEFRTAVAYRLAGFLAPRWTTSLNRAQALSDAAEDWLTRARRTDRGSASPRRYDGRDMGPSWAEAMVR